MSERGPCPGMHSFTAGESGATFAVVPEQGALGGWDRPAGCHGAGLCKGRAETLLVVPRPCPNLSFSAWVGITSTATLPMPQDVHLA
ncbi:hypothetical protein GCM10018785_12070 [Streptomyces longispororuber]|uniref:Uncharacterized protein n=1 Tax=Streptomyces longispororuber TaxID=68230 RepID=A0A919DFV1_9ACTN|nr:hypothetical protein GCM10018785_12070 [Streptomyces longispororuber]